MHGERTLIETQVRLHQLRIAESTATPEVRASGLVWWRRLGVPVEAPTRRFPLLDAEQGEPKHRSVVAITGWRSRPAIRVRRPS